MDIKKKQHSVEEIIRILREVESAFQEYGEPEYIRSDNGSEFIAKIIQNW
jgi:flagellin-specific chaperone FliS